MTSDDTAARELADRIDAATLGLFDIATIYVGDRLGFYRALGSTSSATPGELATATGTRERFTREWCEQQAAVGILVCDDPSAEPDARRFHLPAGHRAVLADRDDPAFAAGGMPGLVAALAALRDLPDLVRVDPRPPPMDAAEAAARDGLRGVEPAAVPAPHGGLAGVAARHPRPPRGIAARPRPGRGLRGGVVQPRDRRGVSRRPG